jgi:small subunit ribosomal protein S2
VIPGNDDAIRSCSLVVRVIADGIAAGKTQATPADFAKPAAEEEPEAPAAEEVADVPEDEEVTPAETVEEPEATPVAEGAE